MLSARKFLFLVAAAGAFVCVDSQSTHAAADRACGWPGIWVSRIASPESNREMWSGSFEVAYDSMTRTGSEKVWHDVELKNDISLVGEALRRLLTEYPAAWTSLRTEFMYLVIEVKFAARVVEPLAALVPNAPRAIRLPDPNPLSTQTNAFCEDVCACWIRFPPAGDSPIRIYFPQWVNLVHAIRKLRTSPDIESATLIRTEGWSEQPAPNEKRLSVRVIGDDCYFTVETRQQKLHYLVTPTQARQIELPEATEVSGFDDVPIPSDAWNH